MKRWLILLLCLLLSAALSACGGGTPDPSSGTALAPSASSPDQSGTTKTESPGSVSDIAGLESYAVEETPDWLKVEVSNLDRFEANGKYYIMVAPLITIDPDKAPGEICAYQEYHIWHDDTNDFTFIPSEDFAYEVPSANKRFGSGNAFKSLKYNTELYTYTEPFVYGQWLGGVVQEGCRQLTITFRYDTYATSGQLQELCKITLKLEEWA